VKNTAKAHTTPTIPAGSITHSKGFCAFLLCLLPAVMTLLLPVSCTGRTGAASDTTSPMQVFVSIEPQVYFLERIGGDRVNVQAMVQPGHSPATYEPSPRQMSALAKARLFFRIGVAFENSFIPKIHDTLPSLKIIDTRKNVPLRRMEGHHHHGHDGHDAHDGHGSHDNLHDDEGYDPHVWLDPQRVKIQARTIADALVQADPAGQETYETNLAAFLTELDDLDGKIRQILEPVTGRTFMVFHPSWGYFADAYGLHQEPIEMEGKDPSARYLARIIDTARSENIRVIFVQPQFSRSKADAVAAAINGTVLTIDPLARNYIENLESAAHAIRDALTTQKDQQ